MSRFFRAIPAVAVSLALVLVCNVLHAQTRTISVKATGLPVAKVLKMIENESGYTFFYDDDAVDKSRIVSVDAKNKDVLEIVAEIFAGTGTSASIIGENIVLKGGGTPVATAEKAQAPAVTGIVIDDRTGESVIGASILIKGTLTGVVTGLDGTFSLPASPNTELEISCVGYSTKTVKVSSKSEKLTIRLSQSAEFLEEVVVVGYGTTKKANLTGAVDQISSEQFNGRPVANTTQMLQGSVPNLNITLADGKPNGSASYNIRGTTSIGAGGSALILIDGVEGDPAMLNPNDIESVSVLKDAASSAIYGSRAPYGVVLITTKNPEKVKDKFTISYSGNFSIEQPTAIPDVVDDGYVYAKMFYTAWYNYRQSDPTGLNKSQEFSQLWLDEFRMRNLSGNPVQTAVNSDGRYVYYGNENYYDAIYKKYVFAQTHNLSVSGASDKISFYVSGRLYDYDGLFNYTPDTYRTMNLRTKVSAQILPWLKLSENLEYTYDKYRYPFTTPTESSGVLWRAINDEGHPSSPIFNPDGTMTRSGANSIGGLVTGNNYLDRLTKTFKTTTALKASFLKNTLHASADFSFRSKDYTEIKKSTAVPYSPYEGEIQYLGIPETDDNIKETLQLTNYIAVNAYAEYENTFASKHWFKALLGYNYEQQTYKSTYTQRYGLISPDVTHINFALGDQMVISSGGNKWRYAGMFFRVNYTYDDRYLFEVNGRYDGSSKFPNNSQWGFFPSASAAWRINGEHWFKVDPKIISNLKLRVSYGELGNSNVSVYSYLEKFAFSTFGTGNGDAARLLDGQSKLRYTEAPSIIPDNIGWERSRTIDAGIDLGFLSGKINLTADYYVRKTLDMYTVGPTIPDTFGASSPKGNYADMSTYGFELSLSYNDSWNAGKAPLNFGVKATLADYHSIIDRYNNSSRKLSDYYAGQRIGEIWGFISNGLFQSQEEIDAAFDGTGYKNTLMATSVNYTTYPGDIRFEDRNHNHQIDEGSNTVDDPGDKVIIGNSEPRWIYSLSLNLEWNGIYANAFFQGVGHQDWYPGSECPVWGQYNRPYNNMPKWQIGNYWTEDNPDAYLPRYTGYYEPFYKSYKNNRYLQNVAYLRLKNLQVGYSFPKKTLERIKLSALNVYFSGENLWTWSPLYKRISRDYDVVTVTRSSENFVNDGKGQGYNYPSMRMFSFGITITY